VHIDKVEDDILRQTKLESLGLKVMRFKASDVLNNLKDVIEAIASYINEFENK